MDKWIGGIFLVVLFLAGCQTGERGEGERSVEMLEGRWEGSIEVPGQPLGIIIHMDKQEEWKGTISIPAQNVEDFVLSDITAGGEEVAFTMPVPGQSIQFHGQLTNGELAGTFTQEGQSYRFQMQKKEAAPEEVGEFLSIETDSATLYGELMMPEGLEQAPVALLIPGSGPTDRNGNSQGVQGRNDSLKMLAGKLAQSGIASVRYDKRGVGKNREAVMDNQNMRFEVFVHDASQWIDKLSRDDRFTKTAVIGHSQGSLVGMMAAEGHAVDAYVSLAGAGQPIDRVLEAQLEESLTEDLYEESLDVLEKLRNGEDTGSVSPPLQSLFASDLQPFLRSWMSYNPSAQLRELDMPVLLVNGTHDIQIPVEEAERLKEAAPKSELLLVEGMNHVLKEAPEDREGNLETYADPDLPLPETLTEPLIIFLQTNGF
ncbi:alpha/beta hydrolase [Halobacillus kuroshimensis]|uniref:Alpha/beta hydrolase n=1 Tax=Halobacillus kuroshimensis TaxID=302481 RepID=A0ABS3DYA2_9BACI|nr:alpha/beta hydrolase [Halobacillus kuroshimensis]MBN8236213.1 alpha/beta hydrolase [Halobacillus kuroshimensis]